MGKVKKVKGLLDDFIAEVKEHDPVQEPGFVDVGKFPPEIKEKIHQNFDDMMDAIYDLVQGKKE